MKSSLSISRVGDSFCREISKLGDLLRIFLWFSLAVILESSSFVGVNELLSWMIRSGDLWKDFNVLLSATDFLFLVIFLLIGCFSKVIKFWSVEVSKSLCLAGLCLIDCFPLLFETPHGLSAKDGRLLLNLVNDETLLPDLSGVALWEILFQLLYVLVCGCSILASTCLLSTSPSIFSWVGSTSSVTVSDSNSFGISSGSDSEVDSFLSGLTFSWV